MRGGGGRDGILSLDCNHVLFLQVVLPSGQTISVEVMPNDTSTELRRRLVMEGVPVDDLRVLFMGSELEEGRALASCESSRWRHDPLVMPHAHATPASLRCQTTSSRTAPCTSFRSGSFTRHPTSQLRSSSRSVPRSPLCSKPRRHPLCRRRSLQPPHSDQRARGPAAATSRRLLRSTCAV